MSPNPMVDMDTLNGRYFIGDMNFDIALPSDLFLFEYYQKIVVFYSFVN